NGFIEDGNYATTTTRTFLFPQSIVGNQVSSSSRRVWIGWRNDGSGGTGAPPMSFDRVNMVASAPATFTATATGGLWSDAATWVGGIAPVSGVGNSIVIPSGSTVIANQSINYADYTINSRRAVGFNRNIFVLNAEVSKAFFPTENLILSINANDIFNQNLNLQRQVNGNIITDNYTRIISRYFLLKLTFKFNNNKTKEDDFNGWH
ncbi:MAG: hypothetical protein EBS86_06650, partial [Crocinitomicaceae bacterium]|nr:hypothetical protein [Crocinitomicaceae bacterium]